MERERGRERERGMSPIADSTQFQLDYVWSFSPISFVFGPSEDSRSFLVHEEQHIGLVKPEA